MITMGKHSYNATNDIQCYEGINLTIGNFCSIGSGLKIYSGTHACITYPEVVSTYPFKEQWAVDFPPSHMGKDVKIGNDVWIATDVRILEGVYIGDGAIIAGGSMVTTNVKPYMLVAGNPARCKRFRFTPVQIAKLLDIAWWDWEDDKIKQAMPFMKDVNTFIAEYSK